MVSLDIYKAAKINSLLSQINEMNVENPAHKLLKIEPLDSVMAERRKKEQKYKQQQ